MGKETKKKQKESVSGFLFIHQFLLNRVSILIFLFILLSIAISCSFATFHFNQASAYTNQDTSAIVNEEQDMVTSYDTARLSQAKHMIAHRGLSSRAPENTLKAFQLAAESPEFWGIECDIHKSADNGFVISHDDNLVRMCGVNKKINELFLSQCLSFPIISGSSIENYKDDKTATRIPTFESYLQLCNEYDKVPIIELKPLFNDNDISHLYTLVRKFIPGNKTVMFISTYWDNLVLLSNQTSQDTQVLLGHVCEKLDVNLIPEYQSRHIIPDISYVATEDINTLVENNIPFAIWTVDTANTQIPENYFAMATDVLPSQIFGKTE